MNGNEDFGFVAGVFTQAQERVRASARALDALIDGVRTAAAAAHAAFEAQVALGLLTPAECTEAQACVTQAMDVKVAALEREQVAADTALSSTHEVAEAVAEMHARTTARATDTGTTPRAQVQMERVSGALAQLHAVPPPGMHTTDTTLAVVPAAPDADFAARKHAAQHVLQHVCHTWMSALPLPVSSETAASLAATLLAVQRGRLVLVTKEPPALLLPPEHVAPGSVVLTASPRHGGRRAMVLANCTGREAECCEVVLEPRHGPPLEVAVELARRTPRHTHASVGGQWRTCRGSKWRTCSVVPGMSHMSHWMCCGGCSLSDPWCLPGVSAAQAATNVRRLNAFYEFEHRCGSVPGVAFPHATFWNRVGKAFVAPQAGYGERATVRRDTMLADVGAVAQSLVDDNADGKHTPQAQTFGAPPVHM